LRAVILNQPVVERVEGKKIIFSEPEVHGSYINTNMNILIDKIVVAPNSTIWFVEVIESLLEVHGLRKDVLPSDLSKKPLY